jgi:murein DD-endopeptidase MepM/ murein hydrolase activator NlpD
MLMRKVLAGIAGASLFALGIAVAPALTAEVTTSATSADSTSAATSGPSTGVTTTLTTSTTATVTTATGGTTSPISTTTAPATEITETAPQTTTTTTAVTPSFSPGGTRSRSQSARHRRRRKRLLGSEPLEATPPLGEPRFVFPVVGQSEYVDSYGAFRSDVSGNWHHGDDIFAPLGTPVVAVATGTINRVGWERVGGWRLWVVDQAGDEFYYAHLSGYTPSDLRGDQVYAGEVIGFIGNTGDAFTTSPHLHFEIHPAPLLYLGYDGAVDPTSYLRGWPHVQHVVAPRPVDPPLPREPEWRSEARYVFRELLAARHLTAHTPGRSQPPDIQLSAGPNNGPPPPRARPTPTRSAAGRLPTAHTPDRWSTTSTTSIALGTGLGIFAIVVGSAWLSRRRPGTLSPIQAEPRAPTSYDPRSASVQQTQAQRRRRR